MASFSRTFPSAARRLPRALPIWSPRWMSGACRSSGPKTAHSLADIVCWYRRSQVSSRNFADPLPATRAVGRCEAKDAIPTATRRRRRIPPPFRSYSGIGMSLQRVYVCVAVQVAPILRNPPRKPCDLSGASPTPRTRQVHAVSRWHRSHTGVSLPCAPKYLSTLAHSDGKRASRSLHPIAITAQNGRRLQLVTML